MLFKNREKIAINQKRSDVLDILEAGVLAVDPARLLRRAVSYNKDFNSLLVFNSSYDMLTGRIFVVGAGKASGLMARELEKIIGAKNITAGIVNVKSGDCKTEKIKLVKAGHPYPDKKSVKGAEMMMELKEKYQIGPKDLVVCLISGGASSLLSLPPDKVSLKDKEQTVETLLSCGAPINEVNTVRRHLSLIKGGRLAAHFAPAKVVNIVLSDVPGNDLSVVGSGPTIEDQTTPSDAYFILKKHGLLDRIPKNARAHIEREMNDLRSRTAHELTNVSSHIIGDLTYALEAMSAKAKEKGYRPIIATDSLAGLPEVEAKNMLELVRQGRYGKYRALIFGGETSPCLPEKHGKGGRCLHFALSALCEMKADDDWTLGIMDTDGEDFSDKAAGAVADRQVLLEAGKNRTDISKYLENYDSYGFFKEIKGSLLETGSTGTNVGDIGILLV